MEVFHQLGFAMDLLWQISEEAPQYLRLGPKQLQNGKVSGPESFLFKQLWASTQSSKHNPKLQNTIILKHFPSITLPNHLPEKNLTMH